MYWSAPVWLHLLTLSRNTTDFATSARSTALLCVYTLHEYTGRTLVWVLVIKCLCIFINLSDLHLKLWHWQSGGQSCVARKRWTLLARPSWPMTTWIGYGPVVTDTIDLTMLPGELLVKRGWQNRCLYGLRDWGRHGSYSHHRNMVELWWKRQ